MATRGAVVGPSVVAGGSSFSMSGAPDLGLLRQSVLYWDCLAYPCVNGMSPNLDAIPELDELVKASVLELIAVHVDASTLPDDGSGTRVLGIPISLVPHVFTLAQLDLANRRSSGAEIWTIAQSGAELTLPPSAGKDAELTECKLVSCLPVPANDVPIGGILDFREKHKLDLLRFRAIIESLRERVVDSNEPQRALKTAAEEILLGAAEIRNAMSHAGVKNALSTMKAVFSVNQSAVLTGALTGSAFRAGGAQLASALSLGAAAALGMNAVVVLAHQLVTGGQQIPGELEGFAYVFHAQNKFGDE